MCPPFYVFHDTVSVDASRLSVSVVVGPEVDGDPTGTRGRRGDVGHVPMEEWRSEKGDEDLGEEDRWVVWGRDYTRKPQTKSLSI